MSEEEVQKVESINETETDTETATSNETVSANETEAVSFVPEPRNEANIKATVVGKVFTGFYLGLFGWLLVHTLLYSWDILIPWNISVLSHLYFNGAFMIYILLLIVLIKGIWFIWSKPAYSEIDGTRWWIVMCANAVPWVLSFSNMAGEPVTKIGSSWSGDDLRYPAFMSQPYFNSLFSFFIMDMASALRSNLDESSSTHMFRPYRDQRWVKDFREFRENWRGVLACGYIYASYWFIFMVISRSWIERIILYTCILMARSCFGLPGRFQYFSQKFLISFVPIYSLVRGYYSYNEYQAYGSRWVFALEIAYCLSQVVIFAGWYSEASSSIASWTLPFMRRFNESEERVVLNPDINLKEE